MAINNPNFTGVLAVGSDNKLYKRTIPGTGPWNPIASPPNNFLGVYITSSKFIAVMKTDNSISTADRITGPWTPVANPGSVRCVITVPVNTYGFALGTWLGVGTDYRLYTRPGEGGTWTVVPQSGNVISIIFASDGTLLGIGTDNMVYKYTGSITTGGWEKIPNSGLVKWLCMGGSTGTTLYGVGTDDYLWYSAGYDPISWTKIEGSNSVISIDMSNVGGG